MAGITAGATLATHDILDLAPTARHYLGLGLTLRCTAARYLSAATMIIDARRDAPRQPLDCDVCIIRAGPAGITLAMQLDHPAPVDLRAGKRAGSPFTSARRFAARRPQHSALSAAAYRTSCGPRRFDARMERLVSPA